MLTLTRRRIALGAICAGLILLPAVGGWGTGQVLRSRSSAGTATPSALPVTTVPGGDAFGGAPSPYPSPVVSGSFSGPYSGGPVPGGPIAVTSGMPIPTSPLPPPVGWKLSDVPVFGPPPPPEPIVLPPGDEVPFLSRVPVTQPVAFLTIDDGFLKNPEAIKLLAAANIPVTLFLTTDAIQDDIPFFDRLRSYGAVIEAHTISHPELAGRSYAFQKRQICGSADRLGQWYGRRPVLFRPPFGDKDHTTLRVARECGLTAAFMWKETVDKGKVRYQEGHSVQPGDIILMHFRPAFIKDFLSALRAIHQAGLTPALLEDYIPEAPPATPPGT